ncbi:hypothetical protein ACED23_19720 [Vibrio splendidus]|uniref:Cell division protein FtsX n=1 Tax=Vibrio splendidus TaxID=29497 RepID=A0ABV4M0T7_VIBSP
MKLIDSLRLRFEDQIVTITVTIVVIACLLALISAFVILAKSALCHFEISNDIYTQIISGSHEYDEIKQMSMSFLANDNRIDYCEASELQKAYDRLTSSKAVLLGWL